MCTVTFLPFSRNQYLLTSNRDESIHRPTAIPLTIYSNSCGALYYPKDPQGGGSWFVTNGHSKTLCLLNGAFEKHQSIPNHLFSKSRGIMVLEAIKFPSFKQFCEAYDFENIEPFTLISVEIENDTTQLMELRWDGEKTHVCEKSATIPHIWSSTTLYSKAVREVREFWFKAFLKKNDSLKQEHVIRFHQFAGDGEKESDLMMQKEDKQTVSICSLHVDIGHSTAIYSDVVNNETNNYIVYH